LIVLGEYQIPYFGEPSTIAIGFALRFSAPESCTQIIVNFAAWSARAGIANRSPKVIFFAKSQYLTSGNSYIPPISEGFIVVKINGYPQPFLGQLQISGDKLPGPGDSFLLKIITHAEISQHLEERKMSTITDQVYISGTKTLLAGS
jgi:hypothetical protein